MIITSLLTSTSLLITLLGKEFKKRSVQVSEPKEEGEKTHNKEILPGRSVLSQLLFLVEQSKPPFTVQSSKPRLVIQPPKPRLVVQPPEPLPVEQPSLPLPVKTISAQQKKKPRRKKKRRNQGQNQGIFLVLDTNCMLSSKGFFLKLLRKKYVFFVVPNVVVKELEGIQKREGKIGKAAQSWIKILNKHFNPKTTGQKTTYKNLILQGKDEQMSFSEENLNINNDDLIWNCAQYYTVHRVEIAKRYNSPPASVALVTDDKRLTIDARKNGVKIFSLDELKHTPLQFY